MLSLIRGTLLVWVAACAVPPKKYTPVEYERAAAHYDATADTIATNCWKARHPKVAVNAPNPCQNEEDIERLNANRAAANQQRAQAAQLREMQANGDPLPVQKPEWMP